MLSTPWCFKCDLKCLSQPSTPHRKADVLKATRRCERANSDLRHTAEISTWVLESANHHLCHIRDLAERLYGEDLLYRMFGERRIRLHIQENMYRPTRM